MGDIYRNANCVLVWLGPAADDSDAYFDYLEDTDEVSKEQMKEAATSAVSFLAKRPY